MGKVERLRKPLSDEIVLILNKYGEALRAERKWTTALAAARRGLAMDPTKSTLWATLGCTLWNMGKYEEALVPMERAIALAPSEPCNYGNLGLLYHSLRDFDSAEACFTKALRLSARRRGTRARKDYLGALWDRALMRLEGGDWARGLPDYDSRLELKGAPLYPKMPIPLWEGQPLDGKTLYVQAEQGLGDRILFSRYLCLIKERWPTCTIKGCFNELLADLFWEYRNVTEMLPHGIPWPEGLDFGVHQASLPRWLGTTPGTIPPDPGLILKRVSAQAAMGGMSLPQPLLPSLKVGIAWTGNPEQSKNHFRTIPLEKMLRLSEDSGVTLYSFQVGPGTEALQELSCGELVCDIGSVLGREGLVSAGVAMLEMDLIVTACTATAHLAGALGVPTWVLLSWDAYWIWLRNREDSPWYPSVRLFRQKSPGDWDSVLDRVLSEIQTLKIPLSHPDAQASTF